MNREEKAIEVLRRSKSMSAAEIGIAVTSKEKNGWQLSPKVKAVIGMRIAVELVRSKHALATRENRFVLNPDAPDTPPVPTSLPRNHGRRRRYRTRC